MDGIMLLANAWGIVAMVSTYIVVKQGTVIVTGPHNTLTAHCSLLHTINTTIILVYSHFYLNDYNAY